MNAKDEINQLVNWYTIEGSKSMDAQLLTEKRGELSGYSFFLAEYAGNKYAEQITHEHNRKVKQSDLKNKYIDLEYTVAKSEALAFNETKELRQAEKVAEREYKRTKLKLEQINAVLSSMQQQIAVLRAQMDAAAYNEQH